MTTPNDRPAAPDRAAGPPQDPATMADPVQVAIRQAAATERHNRLLARIDLRLARIEQKLQVDPAAEPDAKYAAGDEPEPSPGAAAAAASAVIQAAIERSTAPNPDARKAAEEARKAALQAPPPPLARAPAAGQPAPPQPAAPAPAQPAPAAPKGK